MDKYIKDLVARNTPKMNKDVVDSLVVKMLPYAEKFLDDVFRAASLSFPSGLRYIGFERATPMEEYRLATKANSSNKRVAEISRSDVYCMKYYFEYEWEETINGIIEIKKEAITRYIHLPFVGEGGSMIISGKKIFLHPVMTDRVISPSNGTVFVRLMRDKIIFRRLYHAVYINNVKTTSSVVYAELYRNSNKNNNKPFRKLTKASSSIVNYLLGKFGFSDFFRHYLGFVPEIGHYNREVEDANSFVFRSTKLKPRTYIDKEYIPSDIYIKIPKDKMNNLVKDVITAIFYIIDNFPSIIKVEYFDDPRIWMRCLGYIIFNGNNSTIKIMDGVIEHYNSLDEYVDSVVTRKLLEDGYHCNNFYDLLILVIENFSNWIIDSDKNINTMYGKELSVLYPIFYPLTRKLFSTAFKLNKSSLKKKLSIKEIIEIMNKNFTIGIIYDLSKTDAPKSNVNYPGDNKFFKITSTIIPQATNISSESNVKKKRVTENDPINKIHASIVEAGGYLNVTKPHPTGIGKINPYVYLDANNTIVPDPSTKEYFEWLQYALFNKISRE